MPDSKSPWFTAPDRLDTGALPVTEPHPAPIFDTGPHPEPIHMFDAPATVAPQSAVALADPPARDDVETAEPPPAPAQPVAVPGQYQHLKWWKFMLLTLGVWAVAAAVGVGLYYWWFHSVDKTWVDFSVLLYAIVCMVSALVVSMVEQRPTLSATAIAIMSAPFASGLAAAALYGMYVFGWLAP